MLNEKHYSGVDAGPERPEIGKELCTSEAQYRHLFDHNLDAVFLTSSDGTIWDANPTACAMLGMSKEEICRVGRAGILDNANPRFLELLEERERTGKIDCELRFIRKDGSKFLADVSSVIVESGKDAPRAFVIARDITERKRDEQTNRQLAAIVNSSTDAIIGKSLNGTILSWNDGAEQLYGFSAEEVLGKPISILVPTDHVNEVPEILSRIGRGERISHYETLRSRKDGSLIHVSLTISPVLDEQGQVVGASTIGRDISDRKRLERERQMAMEFLRQANASTGTDELIQRATRFFQEQSGCEAVGIRLRKHDDCPYYETRGFSQEFVQAENSLCARCENGEPQQDDSGNPVLECMCGNVICGRFDPSKPFFTPYGSFWTNGTTELLASTSEADRQARTRNRCNGEGYESVALIPLVSGNNRLGLLQLNDHRKGRFTAESIALWERLAGYMAVAVAKSCAEEELRAGEQRYHSLFNQMTEGFALHEIICDAQGEPCDYRFLDVNPAFERLTGLKRGEVVGKTMREVLPDEKRDWIKTYGAVALSGQSVRFESRAEELGKDYEVFAYRPVPGQFAVIFSDVTERKQAEHALQESEERFSTIFRVSPVAIGISRVLGEPFVAVNDGFCRLFGYSRDEVLGHTSLELGLWPDLEERAKLASRLQEQGRVERFEASFRRKSGEMGHLLISADLVEVGGQKHVLGILTDITERKRAEQERLEMERRLLHAQKLESIGVLAGGIAHDFNNILAGIMGYADLA